MELRLHSFHLQCKISQKEELLAENIYTVITSYPGLTSADTMIILRFLYDILIFFMSVLG